MSADNQLPTALLRHALSSTTDGVVIADARAEDQQLIFVNPAFTEVTGYTYEESVGKNCRFLQGSEHDQPELQVLRDALRNGIECRVTLRNFRKDGTLFWNELHVAPIHEDGQLAYFVGIQSDVTARVKAEQQTEALLRTLDSRNHELEELNEEKNRFVGMAAHDLRNPLSSISTTAQLLEARAEHEGNTAHARLLRQISDSADYMSDLILDMLDVSRIESGQMELLREPSDLALLVEQTLNLQHHAADEKNIQLTADLFPGIDLNVDRRKIIQVIDNLISNAIKYTPEGSSVVLEIGQDPNTAWLKVTDQGCGIEPSDQKKIFEPFGRIEKNRPTGGESSTGLGLFISHNIIAAHGGRLEVESISGKGSSFTMHLPVSPPKPAF